MTWLLDDQAPAYATHNTSGTSWNPFTIAVSANRIIFVTVCIEETPSATVTLSKPGGETNDWIEVVRNFITPGGGAGEQSSIWGIKTSVTWNHALTVTFSSAKVAKIANWTSFSGGSLVPRTTPIDQNVGGGSSVDNLPFPSVAAFSGQSEARLGDLVIGCATGDSAPTLDSDTTNGSWVNAGNAAAGNVASIGMRMEYKIATARGTQTLDGTGAAALGGVVFCPEETFHVITEGGDIDSATAHPAWYFRTAASPGPDLFAMTAGELLVGGTMHKDDSISITTPSGYTKYGSGKTAPNADSAVNAFRRESDGSEGAKVVVTTTGGLGAGAMLRLMRGGADADTSWLTQGVFGADNTMTGTSISITADAPLDLEPGDKVIYFLADYFHDAATSIVMVLPGMTFTQYDVTYNGFITDPDGGISAGYCEIDAGSGSVTPGLTATYNSGQSAAPAAFIRVRSIFNPTTPIITSCSGESTDALTIDWIDGGDEPAEYFEVRIDGGTETNVGLVFTHTFTGLDPNTLHLAEVRGCIVDGPCTEWDIVECWTCPLPPVGLTVAATDTSLELCWEPGS